MAHANGKICYIQIPTQDVARSVAFYQSVFGWKTRRRSGGEMAFDDGTGDVSGAWVTGRPPSSTPGLVIYVMVDDIVAASDAVGASGGKIVQPMEPGAREMAALFADPDGNVLGLYQEPGNR
jgi:predicted enzyme related to lactoylglutathione lyase